MFQKIIQGMKMNKSSLPISFKKIHHRITFSAFNNRKRKSALQGTVEGSSCSDALHWYNKLAEQFS